LATDADYEDAVGTQAIDSKPASGGAGSCAEFDLGSSLGSVATGDTHGHTNAYTACDGSSSPDVSYAWTAPSTAMYTIDLCSGPDQSFDSTLTVLDGSCTGTRLACDDDGCGTWLSRVHVSLQSGQLVIIVVDGYGEAGKYTLRITPG
jgi:hypothetical protein